MIFHTAICVCALLATKSHMRRKQRRNEDNMFHIRSKSYKFSDKVHSKRGIWSTIAVVVNLFLLFFSFYQSAVWGGKGPLVLGIIGFVVLFLSLASMILASKGFRETDVVYTFPLIGMIGNGILFLFSLILYIAGLM